MEKQCKLHPFAKPGPLENLPGSVQPCSSIKFQSKSQGSIAKPRPWRFPRRIPRSGSPCKNHVLPPNCLGSNRLMLLLMGVTIEVNLALVNWHSPVLPEARIFCRHTGDQRRMKVSTTHIACIVPMPPKKNTKVSPRYIWPYMKARACRRNGLKGINFGLSKGSQ